MRTTSLLFALLLLTVEAQDFSDPAFVAALTQPAVSGGGGACATTDTALPHDELIEGWQGVSEEATWTWYVSADCLSYNDDYDSSALTTGKPSGACSEAMWFDLNETGTGSETAYWNRGSAIDTDTQDVDIVFYFYVLDNPDEWEGYQILSCGTSTDPVGGVCANMEFRNWGGGDIEVAGAGNTTSTYEDLTDASWNKIALHIDTTAADCSIRVNDGTARTFTRTTQDFQYLHFGAIGKGAAEDGILVVDLIAVNTP